MKDLNNKRRLITLFTLLTVAFSFVLTSCSSVLDGPAMKYKDIVIPEGCFSYSVSQTKTSYMLYLTGASSTAELEDYPALWEFVPAEDGVTIGEVVMEEIVKSQKLILFFASYANEKGITLTDEEKKSVKSEMDTSITTNFKSRSVFNEALKTYGLNYDMLLEYNTLQLLASKARDIYFSQSGESEITEETMKNYYEMNYYTSTHIFVNNKTVSMSDTTPLSEDEAKKKTDKANDILKKVQNGEKFESFLSETDEETENTSEQTITFSEYELGFTDFSDAVSKTKIGEVTMLETSAGIYLIKRQKLDTDHFETFKENIFITIADERSTELIDNAESEFVLYDDVIAAHHVTLAPLFK
ncbi:MAG: hypothetical protein E7665_05450 [Ruminococcaceae bacterium]|nr:hypothetical protein [Oscillospiraceae bacterium]